MNKIRNSTILILILAGSMLGFYLPDLALKAFLPASIFIVLSFTFYIERLRNKDLIENFYNLQESSEKLVQQVNINYNNTHLTNELGEILGKQTSVEDILKQVTYILENRLDYDRCIILLADEDKKRLFFHAGYGYTEQEHSLLEDTVFHLDKPDSKGAFVVSFIQKRPLLINDLNDIGDTLSPKSLDFAKKMGAKSFICCPIICEEESIGVLAVDNVRSKRTLVQSDLSLLSGIAHVIGISIRNVQLMQTKVDQFKSIIKVLAASIDARDHLTSGHSEKVTEYALGICEELGVSEKFKEVIQVAALLHDYGKIGVPDSILKKPGKLNASEYEIVKRHAEKSGEILEQINFKGEFKKVPEIASAHHEKLDGSGYPFGLKGSEIPLGARIIAVADFFEAITAKRHYRGPMSLDSAFKILIEKRGTHFDKEVVDAFCRYFRKNFSVGEEFPRNAISTK